MDTSSSLASTIVIFVALLGLVSGLGQMMAPQTLLKAYNAPTGLLNSHIFVISGTYCTSFAIMALALMFGVTTSYTDALGYGMIPIFVTSIKHVVANKSASVGYSKSDDFLLLVLGALIFVGTLGKFGMAGGTAKVYTVIMLLNGANCAIFPSSHAKAYGTKLKALQVEPIVSQSLRALGLMMLLQGTFVACLCYGMHVTQAFGYSWIWAVISTLLPVLSEANAGVGVGLFLWFIPHALVLSATLMIS